MSRYRKPKRKPAPPPLDAPPLQAARRALISLIHQQAQKAQAQQQEA